jgi:4-amino-4-deoxy-L-arabinose transferase-like glycosyltransferase
MKTVPSPKGFFTILLPAGLILLALFMGFYNLDGYLMNNDEETYLYGAWRVSLGEVPYRDFLIVQTPLSFYLAAALFKAFGPSVWWVRALSYAFMLGTAFLLYQASKKIFKFNDRLSLLVGAVFLFTKHIYFLGRTFMPDCSMLFLATAALYFALKAETGDDAVNPRLSLFLFGVLSGLAALAKLNAILLFGGYWLFSIFLLAARSDHPRAIIQRLVFSSAGFLATFGLGYGLMMIFVPGTYLATLGFHLAKQKMAASELILLPLERLIQFVGSHNYGLIPLAIAGLFSRPVLRDKKRALLLIIMFAILTQVFIPVVFYPRYVVLALVPLAIFFGDGIAGLASLNRGKYYVFPAVAALILLSLGPTFNLKKLRAYDRGTRTLAAYVQENTSPDDYVFGETPFANFYARRPCPPRLVDVSMARTKSGQVTPAEIRNECERYKVKMILVEKGPAAHNLKNLKNYSQFQAYLDQSYELVKTMPREFLVVDIYRRRTAR